MQPRTQLIALIIFLSAIFLAVILHALSKKSSYSALKRGQMRAFIAPLITFGVIELVFLWFHYERVPVFQKRIWFLFVFLITVIWVSHRAKLAYKVYPREHERRAVTREREQYLPRKKR